jgi:hypothetical protein
MHGESVRYPLLLICFGDMYVCVCVYVFVCIAWSGIGVPLSLGVLSSHTICIEHSLPHRQTLQTKRKASHRHLSPVFHGVA